MSASIWQPISNPNGLTKDPSPTGLVVHDRDLVCHERQHLAPDRRLTPDAESDKRQRLQQRGQHPGQPEGDPAARRLRAALARMSNPDQHLSRQGRLKLRIMQAKSDSSGGFKLGSS